MSAQDYEQLTLFQEDSRASHSVLPGSDEAKMMTVISGRKCCELYRKYGPLGSLVRMLLGSSIWRSTRCYLTWKASDTPARRLLFRLAPSTPRIVGTDAQLWPAPTAADSYTGNMKSTQQKPGSMHSVNLSDAVKMWPTPKASDCKGSGPYGSKSAEHDLMKKNLKGTVMYYASITETVDGGQLNPDWVEWLMAFPPGWTDIG